MSDEASRRWVERLARDHPRHAETVAQLHQVLHRAALHELHRRRGALSGPEFEDVAQQCAGDALVNVLGKLGEFQGLSRFTTWAYKFVIFEVSHKTARHAWRHHPPSDVELERLPDTFSVAERVEQRAQLHALSEAIGRLTPRQREVFVAVALNEVPIDVLALKLGTNRNALYKNLFDARRRLREELSG